MSHPAADPVPALHVVQLADVASQPWRNGGGVTRELLAWPSPESWTVRVSVARIDRDGAFSAFPGVWRAFAVLRGNGVELSWPADADRAARVITAHDDAATFDGSEVPHCRLLDGATDALNVMFPMPLRGVPTGQMRRVEQGVAWSAPAAEMGGAAWRAMYTDTPCTLHVGNHATRQSLDVRAGSLVWCDLASPNQPSATPWRVDALAPLRAWWIVSTIPHASPVGSHVASHVASQVASHISSE